jgi:hypothetical protein
VAAVPEIEDIDVPDDSLIDTEPKMSENNNMDVILNEHGIPFQQWLHSFCS